MDAQGTKLLHRICLEALCLAALLFTPLLRTGTAYGQAHEVSGTVTTAEEDAPLPGVNVLVMGTAIGTITDAEGTYTLTAPSPGDTLLLSFVGFEPAVAPIAGRSVVDVALDEDVSALNEVLVVGYGTQTRSDVTGVVLKL